jgi:hypothetical protein
MRAAARLLSRCRSNPGEDARRARRHPGHGGCRFLPEDTEKVDLVRFRGDSRETGGRLSVSWDYRGKRREGFAEEAEEAENPSPTLFPPRPP